MSIKPSEDILQQQELDKIANNNPEENGDSFGNSGNNLQSTTNDLSSNSDNNSSQNTEQPSSGEDNLTTGQENGNNINTTEEDQAKPKSQDKGKEIKESEFVSRIEGAIHSQLDILVDENWYNTIIQYKNIFRIVFIRGVFIITSIIGITIGYSLQKQGNTNYSWSMITDSDIQNKRGIDNTTEEINKINNAKNISLNTIIPYGKISNNGNNIESKNNLISYNNIILPASISFNYKSLNFSIDEFTNQNLIRDDIELLLNQLISNSSNLTSTKENVQNTNRGLIEQFHLSCLNSNTITDALCNKLVNTFYKYGKYFNLSNDYKDLLQIVTELSIKGYDIQPICNMIEEFTLRTGIHSNGLQEIMTFCKSEDLDNYKKISEFIDANNSLETIEWKVSNYPDINAYLLLSIQQILYKNLYEGGTPNVQLIQNYLTFLQNLLDKDNKSNKYIEPIYKDLTYIFNEFIIKSKLDNIDSALISMEDVKSIKNSISQINQGNIILGHIGLQSQLTTPGMVDDSSIELEEDNTNNNILNLFNHYLSIQDLKVRKVQKTSSTGLQARLELGSEDILSHHDNKTLKLVISFYSRNNVLYVDSVTVASYYEFSKVINTYIKGQRTTLKDVISYIEENFEFMTAESMNQNALCTALFQQEDLEIYSCDSNGIELYKNNVEYKFIIDNGILSEFELSNAALEAEIRSNIQSIMINRSNSDSIIKYILDYKQEIAIHDTNINEKLKLIDQFRIHFARIPKIYDITGDSKNFIVEFTLGDFDLQAHYNIDTNLLTHISYMICDEPLEIRNLTIELSANNEDNLSYMINNPRMFLTKANEAAYKKYKSMLSQGCEPKETEED